MGLGDTGLGDTGRGETDRMDKDLLAAVRDNIGKAMTDLRDLARSLSSDRIQSRSLHETLAQEIERVNKTGVIRVEATIEGDIREIEGRKKLILFRIIQESIQNCVKHAEATSIFILFHYRDEGIHVCIRDNGKGFDTEAVLQAGNGLGLGNIRTRVQLTGGSSSIESVLQEGTRITLNIPYE
jgi:two-component system, NarL family, sensor kinase